MIRINTKSHAFRGKFPILLLLACIAVTSCKHSFPEVPEDTLGDLQEADMSKVIFVGSSLLAGTTNGALTESGLPFSAPQILLNHFENTEQSTNFSPLVTSENGQNIYEQGLTGQYELYFPSIDTGAFDRRTTPGEVLQYANGGASVQNYSFPHAQILDFTETGRNQNTFISTFFGGTNQSLVDIISSEQASLFLLNMGHEDLLGYAINGAEGAIDAPIATHTYQDILEPSAFEQRLESLTNALLDGSNKGALFNIPDFLLFPFFTKVKWDVTPFICEPNFDFTNCTPTEVFDQVAASIAAYNSQLTEYYDNNPGIPFADRRPILTFENDAIFNWGILIEDSTLDDIIISGNPLPKVRHMGRGDIPFYNVESELDESTGIFPNSPVDERNYLRIGETQTISDRINAYNQAIENVVAQSNGQLVLIDIKSLFDELFDGFDAFLEQPANGILIEGVPFLPIVGEFGIFSADGLNLNPRGNALLANFIVEQLNTAFNGTLKGINPNAFPGTPIALPD